MHNDFISILLYVFCQLTSKCEKVSLAKQKVKFAQPSGQIKNGSRETKIRKEGALKLLKIYFSASSRVTSLVMVLVSERRQLNSLYYFISQVKMLKASTTETALYINRRVEVGMIFQL